jgi:hypothetical protein
MARISGINVIYPHNTLSSTALFVPAAESAGLDPPYQWFQRDDPNYSHKQIEWRLNENRPLSDDTGEVCDEPGPDENQEQDQADADQGS